MKKIEIEDKTYEYSISESFLLIKNPASSVPLRYNRSDLKTKMSHRSKSGFSVKSEEYYLSLVIYEAILNKPYPESEFVPMTLTQKYKRS